MAKIPLYKPHLDEREEKAVVQCVSEGWISSLGTNVPAFETEFTEYLGGQGYSTTCSNGTVALHLALLALDVGPGDEVLVPSLTYVAPVNAVKYVGATPVFVDIIEDDLNVDVNDLKKKITPKTKAIMCVHLYGIACDVLKIVELCNANDLFLIEDCAESLGAKVKHQHTGKFGDISTFSFFGNKTITTGEGGMVHTNNPKLDERVKKFKGQGVSANSRYYHDILGYNYRMTNICAAIGRVQLSKITYILETKRKIHQYYSANLKDLPLRVLKENCAEIESSYWLNVVILDKVVDVVALTIALQDAEIETRPLFSPVESFPYFSETADCKVSKTMHKRGICLPSFPDLTNSELNKICQIIRGYYAN